MPKQEEPACEPTGIVDLANRGEELIAAIGEQYIRNHFMVTCPSEGRLFASARLENFSRGCFPRILVDAWHLLDQAPETARLQADVAYLQRIVTERPDAFARLFSRLDDPDAFAALAEELGLTEDAARRAGGGLLALVVVLVACVVISGCKDPKFCQSRDPSSGLRCMRPFGHPVTPGTPSHVNQTKPGTFW